MNETTGGVIDYDYTCTSGQLWAQKDEKYKQHKSLHNKQQYSRVNRSTD